MIQHVDIAGSTWVQLELPLSALLDQRQRTFIAATSTSAQKTQFFFELVWYLSGCVEVEAGPNVTGIFEGFPVCFVVCGTKVDKLLNLQEPQMLTPEAS